MGMDLHAATQFMLAVKKQMMKNADYVYVLPWLAHVRQHNMYGLELGVTMLVRTHRLAQLMMSHTISNHQVNPPDFLHVS